MAMYTTDKEKIKKPLFSELYEDEEEQEEREEVKEQLPYSPKAEEEKPKERPVHKSLYEDESDENESEEDIKDTLDLIMNEDESDHLWCYSNSVTVTGRLYFKDHIKVDDTTISNQVASFNLLIKKKKKNGIKAHRIYVKTYNKNVIEWLQDQKVGTWVRVEGHLEAVSSKTYINAMSIQAFTEEHLRAAFGEKEEDRDMPLTFPEAGQSENNRLTIQKLKQIKSQAKTISMVSDKVIIDPEDGEDEAIATAVGVKLSPKEIESLSNMANSLLIRKRTEPQRDRLDKEELIRDLRRTSSYSAKNPEVEALEEPFNSFIEDNEGEERAVDSFMMDDISDGLGYDSGLDKWISKDEELPEKEPEEVKPVAKAPEASVAPAASSGEIVHKGAPLRLVSRGGVEPRKSSRVLIRNR